MSDYGDQWRERREHRRAAKSKLHKCACGHSLYDFDAVCPICETPNTLYGAKTPAAPSQPLTRDQ
jgi:rubrerythrin